MIYPIQIFFGLTYRCNLNCKHCYSKEKRNQPDKISKKRAKTLLKELSSLGILKIVFTHGETLLREDFFEILDYCSKLKLHSTLLSNGLLLNNRSVMKKIGESNLSNFFVSIDSLNKNYHDNLRGKKGAWDSAINAINLCTENGLNFGIITTISNSNFRDLKNFVLFGISKKAKEIDFLTVRPTNQEINWPTDKWENNYSEIIKSIWYLKKQFGSKISIGFHDPLSIKILKNLATENELEQIIDEGECHAGKYFASITPEGNVYPCNFFPLKLGNIINHSFGQVWAKSLSKREKISRVPEKCQRCKIASLCKGGCRAFSFPKHKNDFPQQDPRCAYLQ